MKNLNSQELLSFIEILRPKIIGSRAQKVFTQEDQLWIELYRDGRSQWLIVDISPRSLALILETKNESYERKTQKKIKNKVKPIGLFFKSHFLGRELIEISIEEPHERIVNLYFSGDKNYQMCAMLFPKGRNIILTIPEKKISWNKVYQRTALSEPYQGEVRSYEQFIKEWRQIRHGDKTKTKTDESQQNQAQALHKLEKSIEKLKQDIEKKKNRKWREVAKKLQDFGFESLSEDEKSIYWKPDLNLVNNIEHCFDQAKKNDVKLSSSVQRLTELSHQKVLLENSDSSKLATVPKRNPAVKISVGNKVQKNQTNIGNSIYIGSNARDNLDLLRKSKPWTIWFHLKDFPGAHGFLFIDKNKVPKQEELDSVAKLLVEKTFKQKAKLKAKERFDVIYTECRFVNPIKGDHIGRVNYKNEKSFVYKYE